MLSSTPVESIVMSSAEPQALELARVLIGYMPQNNLELSPAVAEWREAEVDGAALDSRPRPKAA